jgi:hypothetical protein
MSFDGDQGMGGGMDANEVFRTFFGGNMGGFSMGGSSSRGGGTHTFTFRFG